MLRDRITKLNQSLKIKKLGISQNFKENDFAFDLEGRILLIESIEDVENVKSVNACQVCDGNGHGKYLSTKIIKAFDGAQIDNLLPLEIETYYSLSGVFIKHKTEYSFCYYNPHENEVYKNIKGVGETRIEAKTNLLIALLDHQIIFV